MLGRQLHGLRKARLPPRDPPAPPPPCPGAPGATQKQGGGGGSGEAAVSWGLRSSRGPAPSADDGRPRPSCREGALWSWPGPLEAETHPRGEICLLRDNRSPLGSLSLLTCLRTGSIRPVDSLEPRNTLQEPPGRAPPWTRVPLICFRSHSPGRLPSCLLRAPHWPAGKGTLSPLGPRRGTEGGWRAGAQGSTQRGKRPAVAPRTLAARSCSPRPVLVAAPSGHPASCPCAWPSPCPPG